MPSDRPFEDALGRLSRDEFASFVADLFAARGANVGVDGGVVSVDGDRLLVVGGGPAGRLRGRFGEATVDAVVASSGERAARLAADRDATPVGPRELWNLARYGLDPETADDVAERHLGRSLEAFAAPADERGAADAPDSPARPLGATLAVVLALALVLSAAAPPLLALVDAPATGSATPGSSPSPTTAEPTTGASGATDSGSTPTASDDEAARRGGTISRMLAPGLAADGLTSPEALATAHASELGNRSYRWELRYVETVDGTVTARVSETVRVAGPTTFRSDVNRSGTAVGPTPVAVAPSYADGTRMYRPDPSGDGLLTRDLGDDGPGGWQAFRARRLVERYLTGEESTVVRTRLDVSPRQYVVGVDGSDVAGVHNYTATAHVTPRGFVTYLAASYCLVQPADDPAVCVEFVAQYAVEPVDVSPPAWYLGDDPEWTAGRDG